jgi:hypothetical protein
MLVVTEDLVGGARVQDRILGAPFANGAEFVSYARASGIAALAEQPLAKSVDHGFGEAFAGCGGEFSGQAVGFRVFDAQGHGFLLSISMATLYTIHGGGDWLGIGIFLQTKPISCLFAYA